MINVLDYGAKGDGITDDTAAIQSAIDAAAGRGGGKIFFPYMPKGYRIASPGREMYDGSPLRAQLVIPPVMGNNIQLEGEMPCKLLNAYIVRPQDEATEAANFSPTVFGLDNHNTFLFSDWEAPEEHDPEARPWSILAAPQGTSCKGKFSTSMFSITNLEFRVAMNREKMYPTQTAVNLQNVSRANISDSQFCLNEEVGDTLLGKELQPNPCHCAGLILPGDQNDDVVLRNVAVLGFRYGLVAGEHVVCDYLYVHNCEEGITFHDCSHLSVFQHIVAQRNAVILSTTSENLFGMEKGPCRVIVQSLNFESDQNLLPAVNRMKYGVYDADGRLSGSLMWHKPWGKQEFPAVCGEHFRITAFKEL